MLPDAGRRSRGGGGCPQREELIRHLFYGLLLHKLSEILFLHPRFCSFSGRGGVRTFEFEFLDGR